MGRPVLASDHGASGEIIQNGVTGWLFPPGDARMLSERIAHVIRLDEDHRHRIAEEAIRNARENFGKERMCADTIGVYRELLESYEAKDIAIFGTSAGGGLTAAVTLAARDAGLPLPAAVIMHTAWTDLSKTGDSYFTNDRVDPTIPTYDGALEAAANLYAGDAGLKHPLVSPVYADYQPGFPPALLSTGTRDLLLSSTVRLHRVLRRAGIPAELHVFDAMWHGLDRMPEAQELQAEVLAFLAEHLGD